ncbi:hypothetical protein DFR70_104367 [Nocardia tenerifensis]|uniref:DUF6968 domain-containing protein n=1 Tax=Nocardia tenerifensis TaxID=228006 RepID=A0A318K1C2_9NOCA|nr:hypothetical protein [Nocardia tenerifensis]PXX65304.1 hypothetical protein DFR70_104367 [Nocardia tenerifensis]
MSSDIDEVVIARTVQDGDHDVRIEVTDPRPDTASGGWRCTYRIDGGAARSIGGRDGLAAIYAALVEIGDDLARANDEGAHFTVFGQADLGFPARTSGTSAGAQ